ncbi:MAG: LysM peptidoglycan-binding domain-containing protein [Verrucomicrobiales bacterium]|nr:LysM peptidoglycan-binding domain-containing protein [Verrucomicrobiales bacterium]
MRPIFLCLILVMSAPFAVAADDELYTNVYVVPPTFLSMGEVVPADPFRFVRPPAPRKTAKEILSNAGITFGEGASAIYNPASSQLIVRNTQDQMGLVEAYIESITQKVEKQIYVTIREVQIGEEFLKGRSPGEFKLKGGKSKLEGQISEVLSLPPLITSSVKSRALIFESPEQFRKEFSRPPSTPEKPREGVGQKITGVLTDPQFQLLIRELNRQKGIDILSPPSVMCRSGQLAMSQHDEKRYGVQVVIGADESTVDLKIFLPLHGEPLFDEFDTVSTPHQVTISDGQTVVIAERREKGACRFVFVKAQIMDPAGMPFHRKDEKKEGEDSEKKETGFVPNSHPDSELVAKVRKADEAALRGSQLMADGEYMKAAKEYAKALKTLPKHDATVPRREAYEKQLAGAKERFRDDDIFGPGWYEIYVVKKGDTLYQISKEMNVSVEAIKSANGLEGEALKVGHEIIIPRKERGFAEALESIIIPAIDFRDVPLEDALGQMLVLVHKHADRGLFPNFKPRVSLTDAEKIGNPGITLRLRNVPVSEALRYVTSLGQCNFEVEGDVIVVAPLDK